MSDNNRNSSYSNEYAKDTFIETGKSDPLRFLDLGNDLQLLGNKAGIGASEKERARSNFESIVDDKPRPVGHVTYEAVTQTLPWVVELLGKGAYRAFTSKSPVKLRNKAMKKAGKQPPVKNLIDDYKPLYDTKNAALLGADSNKTEVLKTLDKGSDISKLYGYPTQATDDAIREGINKKIKQKNKQLYKGVEAFNRVYKTVDNIDDDLLKAVINKNDKEVNKRLKILLKDTDVDVDDVRQRIYKAIDDLTDEKTAKNNAYLHIDSQLDKGYFSKEFADDMKANVDNLFKDYFREKSMISNVLDDIAFGLGDEDTMLYSFTLMKPNKVYENPFIGKRGSEITLGFVKPSKADLIPGLPELSNTLINGEVVKNMFNNDMTAREIGPAYYKRGLENRPVRDFLKGMFSLDLNDPSRYNEEDIEGYWNMLKEHKIVEGDPSPRQKIQLIKEINKDTDWQHYVKETGDILPIKDYVKYLYRQNKEKKQ